MWGVEISPFSLTWHIAYTTTCCYRTSRESVGDKSNGHVTDNVNCLVIINWRMTIALLLYNLKF